MGKLKLLIAFAVGYVAGAAAGRQRYETIRSGAQRVAGDPRVQSAARKAADTVADKAPVVAEAIKDQTTAAAAAVTDRIIGHGDGHGDDDEPGEPARPEGPAVS